MASANTTPDEESQICQLLGTFAWKNEYLTDTVYLNLTLSATINLFIFPFTILFNGFLVFVIFWNHRVRRRKSNVAVGYLAITDLAVGVVVQPTFVASELCRLSGQCKLCTLDLIIWYCATVLIRSSINHIVMIAWERYVAIKHALEYNLIVTRKRLLSGTIAAWFIPIILEGLLFLEINPFAPVIILCTHVLFSFSMLIYFYVVIYKESKRHHRQIKATTPHYRGQNIHPINQEFRAAKTIAVIILCLVICYLPTLFVPIITFLQLFSKSFFIYFVSWQSSLLFLNSLVNPLIYGWRTKEIKEIVKRTIQFQRNRDRPRVDINEMVDLERAAERQRRISERTQSNAFGRSLSRRWAKRKFSLPTELKLSNERVNSNMKVIMSRKNASRVPGLKHRRHSLPTVKRIDNENPYHVYLSSDIDSQLNNERRKAENERNEIIVTAMVHTNPDQQDVLVAEDAGFPGTRKAFESPIRVMSFIRKLSLPTELTLENECVNSKTKVIKRSTSQISSLKHRSHSLPAVKRTDQENPFNIFDNCSSNALDIK